MINSAPNLGLTASTLWIRLAAADSLTEALSRGARLPSLVVVVEPSTAFVEARSELAGRLLLAGVYALAKRVMRVDVPQGHVAVFLSTDEHQRLVIVPVEEVLS